MSALRMSFTNFIIPKLDYTVLPYMALHMLFGDSHGWCGLLGKGPHMAAVLIASLKASFVDACFVLRDSIPNS